MDKMTEAQFWKDRFDHANAMCEKSMEAIKLLFEKLEKAGKKEWVDLTDEEIEECKIDGGLPHTVNWRLSAKVMQAKLKEKNT